ncbi:thiazole biosynthesis adenylyltransferase ThiF [Bacillus sonorensis]|uniref:thiazole biosynthesis adenylyltransferase ThiF n=1 Tax=Bacillus sonorensis TaxID=119858 RepID=UPI0004976159|nr:thiazole biosynthesis adenylyltransferase ThiF [Bacillus sonorensis]MCF7619330.1 thiazole biosynthesis adenylyltransferase ThiF [Bacillus sonorensis]MCY7855693.1 thiazole biosynthesis adenylyltransferase ThiF [Bacillus sonorensis]MCY8032568.1 thiazole biosynthesis adenylyltransferase ThiF [Bacillus sonorensis]MCY8087268.1 thiazole biosynthesis adenylyltransferase ThiF [Bacillus sonorensis]MCY8271781.1 thiazole biosynthesis adenylyltransferase ThiF [Bacillus sonorensis]
MNGRYSRQELFRPIGPDGQKKLQGAHVLIIGAGALGSASAEMLVRAGVGSLTIVDRDYVEWSNLQRQQLYTEQDVKDQMPKAAAAENRLRLINGSVRVNGIVTDVTAEKALSLAEGASLIIDATDNFETRLVVNDAAVKSGIPFLYGACVASYGIAYTVIPGKTPCLHCLLGHLPANTMTCDTSGVISPIVQQVAAYQVTDALKLLTGHEPSGMLRSFDIWTNERSEVRADALKDQACPTCGTREFPFLSPENETKAAVLCGRQTVQIRPAAKQPPGLEELAVRLRKAGLEVTGNPYLVSGRAEDFKFVIFRDGRAFIHGTNDINRAKTIYHRWIG